jgi:hypothetical protein
MSGSLGEMSTAADSTGARAPAASCGCSAFGLRLKNLVSAVICLPFYPSTVCKSLRHNRHNDLFTTTRAERGLE